jgi:hypothetical protein
MFIFKGKVNGDITIDSVAVSSSSLSDDNGLGKFFDF